MICRLWIESANERQGMFLRHSVRLWHCDDDVCDCARVVVERMFTHRLFPRAYWIVRIAEGPMYTDGEWRQASDQIAADLEEGRTIAREDVTMFPASLSTVPIA